MTNISLMKKVADKTMAKKYETADMKYNLWDWQEGVGMYGLFKAYQYTNELKYLNFLKEWIEDIKGQALNNKTINTMAPLLTVLELYKLSGQPDYKMVCSQYADYCMSEAPRTEGGVLAHTVIGKSFSNQIWADTLFMGALFLAKWGNFCGKTLYLKEAARQLLNHYKYLMNKETGLLFHGYDTDKRDHLSAVYWGRANGWGILSSVEILSLLPEYFQERDEIIRNLKYHVEAVFKYQDRQGGWHTVLNDPTTYHETTSVACFYAGIRKGLDKGYINGDYDKKLDQAYHFLREQIQDQGEVVNTSGGTPIMNSAAAYNDIPCVMSYYGQGLTLLALTQRKGEIL